MQLANKRQAIVHTNDVCTDEPRLMLQLPGCRRHRWQCRLCCQAGRQTRHQSRGQDPRNRCRLRGGCGWLSTTRRRASTPASPMTADVHGAATGGWKGKHQAVIHAWRLAMLTDSATAAMPLNAVACWAGSGPYKSPAHVQPLAASSGTGCGLVGGPRAAGPGVECRQRTLPLPAAPAC